MQARCIPQNLGSGQHFSQQRYFLCSRTAKHFSSEPSYGFVSRCAADIMAIAARGATACSDEHRNVALAQA
jgi:hypothetical protein